MQTLIRFHAEWCSPCKAMAPIIQQLDAEDVGLIVKDVNIDDNPQLRADFSIRNIPTFVLMNDRGTEIGRKTGSATLSEMKEFVDECRRV